MTFHRPQGVSSHHLPVNSDTCTPLTLGHEGGKTPLKTPHLAFCIILRVTPASLLETGGCLYSSYSLHLLSKTNILPHVLVSY